MRAFSFTRLGNYTNNGQDIEQSIRKTLTGAKGVKGVDGLGLMLGIASERPAKEVVNACLARGVLVLTAKDKVRLLPALNIPMELLQKALEILKEELAK
jgi:acetylornithine/N-succinyldiaminopimelate aminotransferase